MKRFSILCLAVLSSWQCFAQQKPKPQPAKPAIEIVTNNTVIDMHRAGLSDDIIINKINSASARFDVSSTSLIGFKKEGFSDRLLAAIMEKANGVASSAATAKPTASTPKTISSSVPAIELINHVYYYQKADGKAVALENKTAKIKVKIGIGVVLPLGKVPSVIRLENAKSGSRINANANPSFIVDCGSAVTPDVVFALYRMAGKKDVRESTYYSVGGLSNDADKDLVGYNFKKLKDGVYELIPVNPLPKGEYCFVNKQSIESSMYKQADVAAFGID